MRQGPNAKRSRGRGGSNRKGHNPRSQVLDSHGPNIRIRGNAVQIFEKYQQLARDATSMGERVVAENLLQHAEHYYRLMGVNGAAEGGDRRGSLHGNGQAPDGQQDSERAPQPERPTNGQADGAEMDAPSDAEVPQT